MESNGKSVTARRRARSTSPPARSSGASRAPTASTPSTSCCTRARVLVPADFIAFAQPNHDLDGMHDLFLANFLAQPRGAGLRPDRRGGRRRRHGAGRRAAQGDAGQPPVQRDRRAEAHADRARAAGRRLRAPRLHPGRRLGHQPVRPVGRRARQGHGLAARAQAAERGARRSTTPTPRPTRWSGCCARAAAARPEPRRAWPRPCNHVHMPRGERLRRSDRCHLWKLIRPRRTDAAPRSRP